MNTVYYILLRGSNFGVSLLTIAYFSVYEPKSSVGLYALIIFRFNDGN